MADPVLAEKADALTDRLALLEAAVRARTRTILIVGVLVVLMGAWMVHGQRSQAETLDRLEHLERAGATQRQTVLDGFERSRQDGIDANVVAILCVAQANRDPETFERCVRDRLNAPP